MKKTDTQTVKVLNGNQKTAKQYWRSLVIESNGQLCDVATKLQASNFKPSGSVCRSVRCFHTFGHEEA